MVHLLPGTSLCRHFVAVECLSIRIVFSVTNVTIHIDRSHAILFFFFSSQLLKVFLSHNFHAFLHFHHSIKIQEIPQKDSKVQIMLNHNTKNWSQHGPSGLNLYHTPLWHRLSPGCSPQPTWTGTELTQDREPTPPRTNAPGLFSTWPTTLLHSSSSATYPTSICTCSWFPWGWSWVFPRNSGVVP